VLAKSQLLAAQSEGTFDITVGPYVKLWRRARRTKEMPSPERLAEARQAVGYRYLELDPKEHTARLLRPGMHLDLGGIAMGYAVDESLALLRSMGITRALLDASGDIGVGDPPPGKPGWRIGLVPYAADAPPSRYLILSNAAVTTSGDAFQHVDIAGKRYSHIVDPRTGLGLTNRSSVTVVARDCIDADSLTKPVSVLGAEAGLKFIEKYPGVSVLVVRDNNGKAEVFESEGFKKLRFEPAD